MSEKKSGKGKIIGFGVGTGVCLVALIGAIIGTSLAFSAEQVVNQYLKVDTYKIVSDPNANEDTEYFKKDFSSVEEQQAHDKIYSEQLEEEGSVLLKNDNSALPLKENDKVSLFSFSSYDYVHCGAGSANIVAQEEVNLRDALTDRKLSVNDKLWSFYEDMAKKTYTYKDANDKEQTAYYWGRAQGAGGKTGAASYKVNEIPQSEYTEDVIQSYSQYNDAAIVVISRRGGELYDLPVGSFQDGTNLLELTTEEKEMFKAIKDSGKFSKTIVLLNTTNAMECDFLDAEEYGIDACLWAGYAGAYGLNGVADVLVGNSNPSGRLVDTYCNDNTTAPSLVGFYTDTYTNYDASDKTKWYVAASNLDGNGNYSVYQEGIYVGYRYYETRYEDYILNKGNTSSYNYASDVKYPFGYGLSYTTFEYSDVKYKENTDSIDITLKVTNTGDRAGKEVVQAYFQSEYTDYDKTNKIEKSAVELCGFAKTGLIEAGKSENVTINVSKEEFETYDAKGYKTYIMDAGNYYLSVGHNAHDALNNILAKKGGAVNSKVTVGSKDAKGNLLSADGNSEMVYGWNEKMDAMTYSVSKATGNAITNQFDKSNLEAYGITQNMLSRSDWTSTWPKEMSITATDEMIKEMNLYKAYVKGSDTTATMPTTEAKNGMTLAMMIGEDYDNPAWDKLLDQLTIEEMATVIGKGFHNTAAMASVSKPSTIDDNGPQGFTTSLVDGASTAICSYTDENIMAATFNTELVEEVGKCIGGDMMQRGAVGLYGPAMDTHRNAYGGRNFEYYSEDGFIAGKIAAAEVKGIQSSGNYVYIKHFALNDSETLCRCVSTWTNEQAIREIYLKPFEHAIVEGGAHNVMNSFARFGTTWSGAHKGLMTNVLRNEWGMDGFALTDFSGNALLAAYGMGDLQSFDVVYGVLAGTNMWDSSSANWTEELIDYGTDAAVVTAMRESAHRILYTVANSHAMNGIAKSDKVQLITPWWKTTLIVLIIALSLGVIALGALLVKAIIQRPKTQN